MGEYVIKCRFQSNRTQRYIQLQLSLSAFRSGLSLNDILARGYCRSEATCAELTALYGGWPLDSKTQYFTVDRDAKHPLVCGESQHGMGPIGNDGKVRAPPGALKSPL